eukprot:CAMPEP_0181191970 /NCGR_PEP_ID=MMETSP1096-20121128/13014_1 /TAXON_ID=156174 ORGANISM="Chrysochromulina ericina, Strain CCMP281" /NCGR_SAMPLE_ID=MMETSP1096 /ASSEMBLY_ACC=CAM_ASM_000453 /LENGTH=164 /DNA_ID=CAMNT_0023281295 /DNA_START=493 /DNA_END=987 /DNA_ORIENTATION=-
MIANQTQLCCCVVGTSRLQGRDRIRRAYTNVLQCGDRPVDAIHRSQGAYIDLLHLPKDVLQRPLHASTHEGDFDAREVAVPPHTMPEELKVRQPRCSRRQRAGVERGSRQIVQKLSYVLVDKRLGQRTRVSLLDHLALASLPRFQWQERIDVEDSRLAATQVVE